MPQRAKNNVHPNRVPFKYKRLSKQLTGQEQLSLLASVQDLVDDHTVFTGYSSIFTAESSSYDLFGYIETNPTVSQGDIIHSVAPEEIHYARGGDDSVASEQGWIDSIPESTTGENAISVLEMWRHEPTTLLGGWTEVNDELERLIHLPHDPNCFRPQDLPVISH